MTKQLSVPIALLVFFALAYLIGTQVPHSLAGAPSGLPATVATSSNPTVGTTASLLFATSSNCAARIITTYANPVMLTFSDIVGQVPSAIAGHLQTASTTVVYDAGLWGCNAVRVYGYAANTAITVTESR